MTMVRFAFFITPELAAGLKALKERDGIPESETIRRALAEYLERKGVKLGGAGPSKPKKGKHP